MGRGCMKRKKWLFLVLFGFLMSCDGKTQDDAGAVTLSAVGAGTVTDGPAADAAAETQSIEGLPEHEEIEDVKTEGFAVLSDSNAHIFYCDLPQNWDYSIYPDYSKAFYEQEGEADGTLHLFFYYSETDPTAVISVSEEGAGGVRAPLENIPGESEPFTFADGSSGIRKVIDEGESYKEYIYHKAAKYYITLLTTRENYLEYESELRAFLDSISFEQYKISRKSDETAAKVYRLLVWNPFLQAELKVKEGVTFSNTWDWEEYEWTMQSLCLYPDGDMQSCIVLEPASQNGAAVQEDHMRTWERCRLASGVTAYRAACEKNGQAGTEYRLVRSGCTVRVYGEETQEGAMMLDSIRIR